MTWIYNGTPKLDAESTYKTGLTVCIVISFLMTVIVALRLYTRLRIIPSVWYDDYFTIAAVDSIFTLSQKEHC